MLTIKCTHNSLCWTSIERTKLSLDSQDFTAAQTCQHLTQCWARKHVWQRARNGFPKYHLAPNHIISSARRRRNNMWSHVCILCTVCRSHNDPQISYGLAKQALKTVLRLAVLPRLKGAIGRPDSGCVLCNICLLSSHWQFLYSVVSINQNAVNLGKCSTLPKSLLNAESHVNRAFTFLQ